jgi:GxxExxY protein
MCSIRFYLRTVAFELRSRPFNGTQIYAEKAGFTQINLKQVSITKEGEMEEYPHQEITNAIICAFYNVYNKLGHGFLEKVYENALLVEVGKTKYRVVAQSPISVYYEGQLVGEYFSDMVAEDKVIVEIKAAKSLTPEHEAQLINYLKATGKEVGLLLNFGPEPQVRRKILTK